MRYAVPVSTTPTPAAAPEPAPAAATVTEAAGLRYLAPDSVRLIREGARLDLALDGAPPTANVSLFLAFPLSDPDRYVSVRNEKQEEIGLIADPGRLDPSAGRSWPRRCGGAT